MGKKIIILIKGQQLYCVIRLKQAWNVREDGDFLYHLQNPKSNAKISTIL